MIIDIDSLRDTPDENLPKEVIEKPRDIIATYPRLTEEEKFMLDYDL